MENQIEITITINKIDSGSMGDWGDENLDDVASRYQKFLAKHLLDIAKSEYPNAIVGVKLTNNLGSKNYSISVSNEIDNYNVLDALETEFAHNNAWDIFCQQ